MAIFENYPYTNLHELNLDYILETQKKQEEAFVDVIEEATEIKDQTEILKNETSDLKNDTQILKDQTSDLKDQTQALKNETSDLKDDVVDIRDSLNGSLNQIEVNRVNIAVNSERITQIANLPEGSTSGDAELADIRTGAYGETYANAGDAVRGQIRNLSKLTDNLLSDAWLIISNNIGRVAFEVDKNLVTVTALTNHAYNYIYQIIPIADSDSVTINYKSKTGTGVNRIRLGTAESQDATTFSWLSDPSSYPYTLDTSEINYLVVALYVSYDTTGQVDNYSTFDSLQVNLGDHTVKYKPYMEALYYEEDIEPLYKHIKLEKGSITDTGAYAAFNATYPRLRSKDFVYLREGDKLISLLPNTYFGAHIFDQYGKWIKQMTNPWASQYYTVTEPGYYKFNIKYQSGNGQATGMDYPDTFYTPFIFVMNDKGYNLYKNKKSDLMECVLHRGMALLAPENTLPAFRMGVYYGFEFMETDIWFTSDGVPVLCHDATVNRTSNGTGYIADKTLAELKALDFGSWFSGAYTGTTIPTLEEALIDAKKYGYKLELEVKENWTSEQTATVTGIIKALAMSDKVRVTGFNGYALIDVHQADPYINIGIAFTEITEATVNATLSNTIKGEYNHTFMIIYPYTNITEESIALAHASHCKVQASIVDDIDTVDDLIKIGVSSIITDGINIEESYNYKDII